MGMSKFLRDCSSFQVAASVTAAAAAWSSRVTQETHRCLRRLREDGLHSRSEELSVVEDAACCEPVD